MAESNTSRTLARLRRLGFKAEVVEKWMPFYGSTTAGRAGGVRKDLFGCIDIVALHATSQTITGVQACSRSGLSAHRKKVFDDDVVAANLRAWISCGARFEFWGWKKGARFWELKREVVLMDSADALYAHPLSDSEVFIDS